MFIMLLNKNYFFLCNLGDVNMEEAENNNEVESRNLI